eukprot:2022614-Amphidinium_carterae.2
MDVAEPDDFEPRSLGGRTICTRTLRSLNGPGCRSSDTSGASPTRTFDGDVVNVSATSLSAQSTRC